MSKKIEIDEERKLRNINDYLLDCTQRLRLNFGACLINAFVSFSLIILVFIFYMISF
jgi:hypothetical protein